MFIRLNSQGLQMDYSYVSAFLTPDLIGDLYKTLLSVGIAPAPKHDFHVTLMYDKRKKEIKEPLAKLDQTAVFKAFIVGFDVLGDGLVLHLMSKELHSEHQRLLAAGYQYSFPDYLPHMSLMYDFNEYDILKLKSVMGVWMGRELTFSNESFGKD